MGSAPPLDITLRLLGVDQLFAPPPPERMHEADTLQSGIDELLNQLSHRPLKNGVRTTIYLPRSAIGSDTEAKIRSGITRYCQLRLRNNANDVRLVQREGIRATVLGVPVAALALLLSAVLYGDEVRDAAQVFFGEGVLLVVAWVALWYPAEALLVNMLPYRRERKLLAAVMEMDVIVAPAD